MSIDQLTAETLRIEVPLASRVLVRGDLLLTPEATPASLATVASLSDDLARWQGTGTVVLIGDLIDESHGRCSIERVLGAHLTLPSAVTSFLSTPGRRIVIVPGARSVDAMLGAGADPLRALGIEIAPRAILECTTAGGTRRVLIPSSSRIAERVDVAEITHDRPWLADVDRLDEPDQVREFLSSRTLYRRMGRYAWIPALVAIVAAVVTHLSFVATKLGHLGHTSRGHHVLDRVAHAPWHIRLLITALVVVIVEIIVGVIVALVSRRVYRRSLQRSSQKTDAVEEAQAPLDLARAWASEGGSGVILGGAMNATLTYLDSGFFAHPGATTDLVRRHDGKLGLPPVFVTHRQESSIDLETGAELHVRLVLRDAQLPNPRRLERLARGQASTQLPADEHGARQVAAWPTGGSWPPSTDLAATQRRARTIRRIAAAAIFITGLLDLLVAVSPPLRNRLHTALTYFPLGISQTAATAVAIAGLALVMLSRGILRGQRRAWLITVVLLTISMGLHLAHAASIGAVVITGLVLALLIVERRWFAGTTDRGSLKGAAPIIITVLVVSVLAAFVGIELSNLHHAPLPGWPLVLLAVTERLVGLSTVDLPDRINDFVYPTMLAVGLGVIVTVLYLLTRPVVDRRLSAKQGPSERRAIELRSRDIVKRHGRGTLDYFALRDDKQLFFYGDSLVAYAVYGGICLVSPDPIGPDTERAQVWGAFRAFCDSRGWGVGVVGAGEEWLPIYEEGGMRWLYLGDEAVVDVQNFSLQGGKMKSLRQANTRIARYGYTAEFLDPSTIDPARVPELADLMGMNRRGDDERGFSMMLGRLFDPKDTGLLLVVVSGPDGRPAAMCQFVPSPAINGYSLDLMRRDPGEHPNGLLDFALCQTIEHLAGQGATGLSLNFSAFRSILDGEAGDGVTQRVERWGLRRLSSILPIETLWKFNEKYLPRWLARYLVYSSPEQFVPTVAAALRAESLTEIPLVGRFLKEDPANRPGTVVPPELLEGRPVHDAARQGS